MVGLLARHLDEDFNPRAPYGARPDTGRCPPCGRWNFNPRAPYGARPSGKSSGSTGRISILAPLTGRDGDVVPGQRRGDPISILAPLTGRDPSSAFSASSRVNFNPRAPYGARPRKVEGTKAADVFQSSRPLRGATGAGAVFCQGAGGISILAPLTGRDSGVLLVPEDIDISILAPLTGRDPGASR